MAVAKDRKFAVPFVRAALTLAAMHVVAERRDQKLPQQELVEAVWALQTLALVEPQEAA